MYYKSTGMSNEQQSQRGVKGKEKTHTHRGRGWSKRAQDGVKGPTGQQSVRNLVPILPLGWSPKNGSGLSHIPYAVRRVEPGRCVLVGPVGGVWLC